ncbi:MAG: hypothetical protein GY952_12190 [Rhodobacteraceae bacterium]|nr:hypothetical protein [Paracoccaceae bacterium]
MTTVALTLLGTLLLSSVAMAASVRIEDAAVARTYVDRVFSENNCRMSFADFDARMRADGIIPTQDEMHQGDIGVLKFMRQRRVMAALKFLFDEGALIPDTVDKTISRSSFGGCA